MRRTVDSVNARWGNLRAILAGDFLLARASELAAGLGRRRWQGCWQRPSAGCARDSCWRSSTPTTLAAPRRRTCAPSRARRPHCWPRPAGSAESSPGRPRRHVDALTTFGRSYGMAFQLVDDVLDLVATEEAAGQAVGPRSRGGRLHASGAATPWQDPTVTNYESCSTPSLDEPARHKALDIVRNGDGIASTIDAARVFAAEGRLALDELPPSPGVTGSQRRRGLPARQRRSCCGLSGAPPRRVRRPTAGPPHMNLVTADTS